MTQRIAIALFTLLAAGSSSADDNFPQHSSQQEKFAQCSHESRGLKGDERHKFMSDCLKGYAPDKEAHQEPLRQAHEHGDPPNRMKSCNDEARNKNLHGDERRAFMSSCLKG